MASKFAMVLKLVFRYIANSCNTQVLVVPELTHPYLLVPAITIYPARIRTRLKKLGKTKVFQYRISKRISQADQC